MAEIQLIQNGNALQLKLNHLSAWYHFSSAEDCEQALLLVKQLKLAYEGEANASR